MYVCVLTVRRVSSCEVPIYVYTHARTHARAQTHTHTHTHTHTPSHSISPRALRSTLRWETHENVCHENASAFPHEHASLGQQPPVLTVLCVPKS